VRLTAFPEGQFVKSVIFKVVPSITPFNTQNVMETRLAKLH